MELLLCANVTWPLATLVSARVRRQFIRVSLNSILSLTAIYIVISVMQGTVGFAIASVVVNSIATSDVKAPRPLGINSPGYDSSIAEDEGDDEDEKQDEKLNDQDEDFGGEAAGVQDMEANGDVEANHSSGTTGSDVHSMFSAASSTPLCQCGGADDEGVRCAYGVHMVCVWCAYAI
jgi:hypothetical protein